MSSDTLGLSFPFDGGGISQVAGWPFNDFFTVGDAVYGLAPGGIYLLGGETDAGAVIESAIEGPMTDGGSDTFKRAREVVVQGDGDFSAFVKSEQMEDWKETQDTGGGRFVVGRDNAGREIQFRIEGTGPVEIQAVTVRLLNLGLRQRG